MPGTVPGHDFRERVRERHHRGLSLHGQGLSLDTTSENASANDTTADCPWTPGHDFRERVRKRHGQGLSLDTTSENASASDTARDCPWTRLQRTRPQNAISRRAEATGDGGREAVRRRS